jgi:carboxyl-terminal processing protease
MKGLILDLRDNGGGILTQATNIADEFLNENKLITYTEGAHSPRKDYRCQKEGLFEKGKVIVLVNEGTASASEILSGALQDWERAIIVGRRTFGKGLVQEQFELSDGSGLRLTVARYFTPLGRSIQKSYKDGIAVYDSDLVRRFKGGEMTFADSIKHTDEKKFQTASGKVLYGGGGITPDIFVPYDTSLFIKEVMHAMMKGTLSKFVYKNYLKNEKEFKQFTSPRQFEQKFQVSDSMLRDLKNYAQNDSIHLSVENPRVNAMLKREIKVLTAREIWRTEGFYEVNNQFDSTVQRALQLMKPMKDILSAK